MITPPTPKNIRVTVPVSPQVLERFKRLSRVAGQSVGKAMGEWLEGTQEGLDPMIAILEDHKSRPAAAIRSLQSYARTIDNVTGDLFQRVMDMPTGDSEDDRGRRRDLARDALAVAESVRVSAPKPGKRGLTPPSSNTGGKGKKTSSRSIGGAK